ncbi:DUF6541 family protein [Brachybacterium sp. DNPG3]
MTGWLLFLAAAACAALLTFGPGYLWARLCRVPALYAFGAAPALTAGGFGVAAVLFSAAGIPWTLVSALALVLVGAAVCAVLGRRLTGPVLPAPVASSPRSRAARAVSLVLVLLAMAVAVGPVLHAMPGPDAVLQRWDALFHLSAVEHVRQTGDGSTLTLGGIAYSNLRAAFYPAAFHDIVALIPFASTTITVNAAAITLATVPWCTGLAVLTKALWPRLSWGPAAAAILGALAPAAPLDEWVHLSPTSNLVGFAVLPGLAALVVASWRALTSQRLPGLGRRALLVAVVLGGVAGIALLHPNVLVSLSLLTAIATGYDAARRVRAGRARRRLLALPLIALSPTLLIVAMPGSGVAQDFNGGLAVPWWQAIGEVGLGLLTVWPMAQGVLIWVVVWVGVIALARRRAGGAILCAAVVAVLYLDAAVDSTLGLSVLWYRGQDRLSMLLTLVAVPIAVAGLAAMRTWWRRQALRRGAGRRSTAVPAVALAVLAALVVAWNVPTRADQAALNFDLDMPNRNRYFDTEEWELLKEVAPTLDSSGVLIASPFSGAAHLYAISGQSVRFLTDGHAQRDPDADVIAAAAAPDASNCSVLERAGVKYVYVDAFAYNVVSTYAPLQKARIDGLVPIAATDHSALYEIDC